jgi:small subunit ribosomal protein S1
MEALEASLSSDVPADPVNPSALDAARTSAENALAPGAELNGVVVGVSGDDVFIEFGARSQGVILRSQLAKEAGVEIGRQLSVVADKYEIDSGLWICRPQGSVQRADWASLKIGSIVEGRVTGLIKGGLEIDLQGLRGFMPGSQCSLGPMKDISVLLNERVRCQVIEIDKRGKNIVVSRRTLLEKERAAAREQLKDELGVGQVRRGVVKNITDFGAFVDLGGIEGLVHIRDLSWGTVEKVTDVLTAGQEIEVKVLKIEAKRNRISLGYKQAQPDPWVNIADRYPAGTELKVRIVRLADFGAFAEVEKGVDGLIPISEMGWSRVGKSADVVKIGEEVNAVVIRVEPDKRRIALSMKRAQPDPWAGVLESFPAESMVPGKITRIADFGAFVELVPGVEGLIHISEMSDKRVRTCADVVSVGQEVEARVLGVDKENRRISLSLKKKVEMDYAAAPADDDGKPDQKPMPKKKRTKPLRGGLSSHFEW